MFNTKKFTAVLLYALFLTAFNSCDKAEDISSKNSVSQTVEFNENGITDIINPDENSEEYELGSYRISQSGIKLYYDESEIPTELMLTLEKYFTSFQNNDFELYKSCLASDYIERYNKYLIENYSSDDKEYSLKDSFELQCKNIKNLMIQQITGEFDVSDDTEHSGDFRITRLKAEPAELLEDETTEGLTQKFFSYLDDVLDMDYYTYISEQADSLKYFTFFVIAEGEDEEEHRIISEMDIVFAEKNGKYYTFG